MAEKVNRNETRPGGDIKPPSRPERKMQWRVRTECPGDAYLVKWRSFVSMLRCRMHILVRAEPTSLVAPSIRKKQIVTHDF